MLNVTYDNIRRMEEYLKKKIQELEQSGVSLLSLANNSGVNRSLLWRMKEGKRPCSLKNALKLEIATGGFIQAEKVNPANDEIFRLLKSLGFIRSSVDVLQPDRQKLKTR